MLLISFSVHTLAPTLYRTFSIVLYIHFIVFGYFRYLLYYCITIIAIVISSPPPQHYHQSCGHGLYLCKTSPKVEVEEVLK